MASITQSGSSVYSLNEALSFPLLSKTPSKPFSPTSIPFPKIPSPPFKTLTPLLPLLPSNPLAPSSSSSAFTAKPRSLKSRLRDGETLYGIFLLSFSPTLAEIVALAGYDFVVVDMEHGPGGVAAALPCLHALTAGGVSAVLRLPESSPAWAKKALDLGPQGIMFPMIDSPKLARLAVSYCRFRPAGVRGAAHPVVRASAYGIDADAYLTSYEEDLLIMCQVESEEGVENAEEIATVDGVDCVQMGPLDLSASMGYLWDPGNRKVREALYGAEKAVLQAKDAGNGAYLGGFAMPHDSPEKLKERGYNMVSGAVDIALFRSACVEDVRKFRLSTVDSSEDDEDGEDDSKDSDEKYWSE